MVMWARGVRKRYEGKVKDGNILISAHCFNSDLASKAKKVFEEAGASDIGSSSEKAAPTPEVKTPVRETARY